MSPPLINPDVSLGEDLVDREQIFLDSSLVALNIKNPEAQRLATEIARLSGQSVTAAVIDALRDRKVLLERRADSAGRLQLARRFLDQEVWSLPDAAGAAKMEEDELLGFGDSGA